MNSNGPRIDPCDKSQLISCMSVTDNDKDNNNEITIKMTITMATSMTMTMAMAMTMLMAMKATMKIFYLVTKHYKGMMSDNY